MSGSTRIDLLSEPEDRDRVEHVRRAIDSVLGTDPAHYLFARALVERGILDGLINERVADLAMELHVMRFAKDDGIAGGPDNFYNGVITSRALLRRGMPKSLLTKQLDDAAAADVVPTEEPDLRAQLEEITKPQWHPNKGYEYDSDMEAYAGGRNAVIDKIRELLAATTDSAGWNGWKAAMQWLSEYKGAEGVALAEEMRTRLPERFR